MLLNRLQDPPTGQELGLLFESWLVNEVIRLKDYYFKADTISFWRQGNHEVDLLIHNRDQFKLAIEIKSGEISSRSLLPLKAFKAMHPAVPLVIASLTASAPRLVDGQIEVLPWRDALQRYLDVA